MAMNAPATELACTPCWALPRKRLKPCDLLMALDTLHQTKSRKYLYMFRLILVVECFNSKHQKKKKHETINVFGLVLVVDASIQSANRKSRNYFCLG